MDISIVIPAFNEALKIKHDVEVAASFFINEQLQGEVIVVDDGSSDNTADTDRKADFLSSICLNVIRLEKNSGKGFAVKTGVKASRGDVVLFADSGTCIPYINAMPYIERIRDGDLDIALASRRLKETVICRNRPLRRQVLSWFFHQAAVWVAGLPRWITDSQCGFKLYRGRIARRLFDECVTTGYLFDVEILLRAQHLGCRIEEFPVEWSCDLDSRLRPGFEAFGVLKELFDVRKIINKVKNN